MKLNKKTTMILSFAIGIAMFSTTALAEVVSKSGYDQLKDSVKFTADSCTSKLSSYTIDTSFIIKDNGAIIHSETSSSKFSLEKQAMESASTYLTGKNKRESYSYSDKACSINKDSSQNIYYINEFVKEQDNHWSKNPFKEKEAEDVEKILDALVGNLKDAVVVKQNSDGSRELSGSLKEAQIPALVNAVVSLQSKSTLNSNSNDNYMPKITKDIYIKDITGNMTVGKDGIIRSVLGVGTMAGKDEGGKEHNVTFEMLVKISNINSTVVNKPDLTGKTIQKTTQKDYSKLSNANVYLGKYKSDIVIEKDGKFQKIGEKTVDITAIDEKSVSGTYHEEYFKGFENYGTKAKDLKFNATFEKENTGGEFSAVDGTGATVKGHVFINQHSANINFSFNEENRSEVLYDGQYNRVFN